jgi:hypothetical protein
MSRISTSDVSPIPAANRKFEVTYRDAEHLAHAVAALLCVFVVVHVARGLGVFQKQPSPVVGRKDFQNAGVALLGFVVLLAILVQDAEVQQ